MTDKVVITAALTGAATLRYQNPNVPYLPEEFVEEAWKCYNEGAAIVHIHARDPKTGMATPDLDTLRRIFEGIRDKCDILINLSTAINPVATDDERIRAIPELKPDMASLNTNTMNFGLADYKTGKILIEYVFKNTFAMIIRFAREMKANLVKPELEVYDVGHINNVLLLSKQDIFAEPIHFNFVMGVAGGIPFSPQNLCRMRDSIPDTCTWVATGVGPAEFPAVMMAALMGGHIRVGLEDNIHIRGKELAKGSYELVGKAVKIAELVDRTPASVAEVREILSLPARD